MKFPKKIKAAVLCIFRASLGESRAVTGSALLPEDRKQPMKKCVTPPPPPLSIRLL